MTMPERIWAGPYTGTYSRGIWLTVQAEQTAPYILATPRPMSEAKQDGSKCFAWWPTHGEWLPTWGNEIIWRTVAGTWTYHDEPNAPTLFLPYPAHPEEPK